MIIKENQIIQRGSEKPILLDYYAAPSSEKLPLIIFCHGYKGFKDWGAWTFMGKAIANAGFCFLKFNFSHNGGTMEQPIDFPDLEAFGHNNYSQEVTDLNDVITWSTEHLHDIIDTHQIYLLGHSRAGGIVSIVASQNPTIKKLITLASVSDYESRFPDGTAMKEWKEKGVFYVKNGRTHQEMPHYYQFYEDFESNKEALNIQKAVQNLDCKHLIIHGENDTTVSIEAAKCLQNWNVNAELHILREANHTFGASHPWERKILPESLRQVVQCSINFLKK